MDARRQKKVAQLIQDEMGRFLQREGANYYGSKFVTVTNATVSPDLQLCKIYISVLQDKNAAEVVEKLNAHVKDIRRRFGQIMAKTLRIIPELHFYLDDTLDNVFRLEEIFKEIHKNDTDNTDKE